jgi:hypothetical protein
MREKNRDARIGQFLGVRVAGFPPDSWEESNHAF